MNLIKIKFNNPKILFGSTKWMFSGVIPKKLPQHVLYFNNRKLTTLIVSRFVHNRKQSSVSAKRNS